MADADVDIVVIGMGPGGEDVAARLVQAGLDVVGVENRLVGGECPYFACIPTKMMLRGADALGEAHRVNTLAGSAEVHPDFAPVARRIREEATTNWDDQAAVERFEGAGGTFIRGSGRITAPGEVTVSTLNGARALRASKGIVLNPGTEPAVPPIDGLADTPYWTNRDAVALERVPESMVVLGSGPVGCEFAQAFARFGTDVTVVETQSRLLPGEEPEAGDLLGEVFREENITVRTDATAARVSHVPGLFTVEFTSGETIGAERLLVATGRRTDLPGLGVGAVGIDESGHSIPVDGRMRAAQGVWAIGDAVGHGAFTHVSVYQAPIAAQDILGEQPAPADYRAVPRVTFTDPEVGAVGRTEAQAREEGRDVRIGFTRIASSARGWIHHVGNAGFIKLIEDAERGVLVGASAAGPAGGEVLGALTVAVHAEVPTERLRQMIYAYPTLHRAIEDALRSVPA